MARGERVSAPHRWRDQPSKVTVDDGDGIILEERLFGSDLSQEIGA